MVLCLGKRTERIIMEVLTILALILGGLVLLLLSVVVISLVVAAIGPPETLDYSFDDDEI